MARKCRLYGLLLCCSFLFLANASRHKTENFDVVIYGSTPSGITAAVAAARENARVIVIGPEQQVGGMVTGGICRTDYGDQNTVGGLAREFFQLCKKIGGVDEWYNEPHIFQKAMSEWISGAGFKVRSNERLTRVKMKGRRIVEITTSNGNTYTSPVFIDASYEGDLMARAGVSYIVGRESKHTYGETFAGIQYAKPEEEIVEKDLEDDCACLGGKAEHYIHGTKMKIGASNPDGFLKNGISKVYPAQGTGDGRTQAYCFRLTVTQRPDIRIPFQQPVNYNPDRYQILLGIVAKYPKIRFSRLVHFGKLPNGKYDMNSSGLQSIDFVGGNIGYQEGDYKTRDRIWQEHKNYQQGFLWFLAHDSRIPKSLQAEVNSWGLCRDEFTDNGNWPYQLYVREARRMTGAYVMTENDLLTNKRKEESIGLGSFLIDSHHIQYLKNGAGWIETEGTIAGNNGGVHPGTYEIPYSALMPKEEKCENLSVPDCLSASHVAYGSLRMEPVYMILGHASGLAAVMAKNSACPVQRINIQELQRRLVEQKQLVKIKNAAPIQSQKFIKKNADFHPAQIWYDNNGKQLNAHGGGVLFFEGIYYWYGEHKLEGKSEATFADGGIHCYSSHDLLNWKDEGLVLSVDYKDKKNDLAYGCILERPTLLIQNH